MRKHYQVLLAAAMAFALWLPATSALAKDRTKPVISEVSSSVKITNKSTSDILIKYRLSEKAKVSIKIYKGSVLVKTGLSKSLKATGRQTWIWKGTKAPGTYTIKIEAMDLSGNVALTKAVSVSIDTTKPVLTNLVSDDPTNYFSSDMGLYLTFNLSETAKVTARAYGGQFPGGYNVFTASMYRGENEIDWDAKFSRTKAEDGKYKIVVTAVDLAGNSNTAIIYVTKDDKEPVISFAGFEKATFNPNKGTNKFSVTASEPVQLFMVIGNEKEQKTYFINIDLLGEEELGEFITNPSVVWDGKANFPEPGGILPDGVYDYSIAVIDKAGNFSNDVSGTIKIDTSAPELTAVSIPDSFTADGTNKFALNFNLTEESKVSAEVYKVSEGTEILVKKVIDNDTKTAGLNTVEWDGKDSNAVLANPGNYVLKIFATDLAGNQTEVQTKNFTITQ